MLLSVVVAFAAPLTEIPPFLRGDVEVGYTYDRLAGSLSEHGLAGADDVEVAQRQVQSHSLAYTATFGVAPGGAVYVGIPHTLRETTDVQEWSRMVYDPSTETGTYTGTATEADLTMNVGNGIDGVWVGAKGTPFSEALPSRHNRVTWLIDGALRTPSSGSNQYTIREPSSGGSSPDGAVGTRGAGEGGLALRIGSVASTTVRKAHPYIGLWWEDTLPIEIDIIDDAGATLASNVTIDPGGHFRARFGTELVAGENEESGSRTGFDLHFNIAYTGASNIPTGVELPGVLLPEAGVIQSAESLEAGAGLALNLRFFRNMELDLYGDGAYHLPQRLEHPYPVYTGPDTIHIVTGANLVVRIR